VAIAKFKPDTKIQPQPNTPSLAPVNYISPAKDEKVIPIDNILAYIDGSEWSVNYYSQFTSKTNDLREVDPGEHPVYQQYTLINKYSLKVNSELATSYDPETGITKVSGSANMFSFIIPNVNDYFVTDSGNSRTGLFKITSVDRKSFNTSSIFEVNYDLIGYINTGASITLYQDLTDKVVKTYYFDLSRYQQGLYPLVLEKTRQKLIDYTIAYRDLVRYYVSTFFNRKYMTFVLPGQELVIYDPFIVRYITKIVESDLAIELKELRVYTIEKDPYLLQPQFWDLMINRCYDDIKYLNTRMGIATKHQFNGSGFLQGFKYIDIQYMVYPLEEALDSTTRVGLRPTPKFTSYLFTELETTTNRNNVSDVGLITLFQDAVNIRPLSEGVIIDNHYVLTSKFYNDSSDMSVIEVLTKDYIKTNTVNKDMLDTMINNYQDLNRLEQFYYGPILMSILKDVVRNLRM